jgi:hypothetical protein
MRLVTLQLLLAFAMANARNDPPPSSDRTWAPPGLSKYEAELAARGLNRTEPAHISINPRKVYNLAELIDIAQRSNPRREWPGTRPAGGRRGWPERERLLPVSRRLGCRWL